MLIRNFTEKTSDIILDYLSPPLNGDTAVCAKKMGILALSLLARTQFKAYWQNTIWGSHTQAEHLLSQVLYTGRQMDTAVKFYGNTSLTKAFELSTTVCKVMGLKRIMFFESAFGNLAYPMLIDVARIAN
jgi:hypothetical protein